MTDKLEPTKPGLQPSPSLFLSPEAGHPLVLRVYNEHWTAEYGYLYTLPWSGEHVYSLIGYKAKDKDGQP